MQQSGILHVQRGNHEQRCIRPATCTHLQVVQHFSNSQSIHSGCAPRDSSLLFTGSMSWPLETRNEARNLSQQSQLELACLQWGRITAFRQTNGSLAADWCLGLSSNKVTNRKPSCGQPGQLRSETSAASPQMPCFGTCNAFARPGRRANDLARTADLTCDDSVVPSLQT